MIAAVRDLDNAVTCGALLPSLFSGEFLNLSKGRVIRAIHISVVGFLTNRTCEFPTILTSCSMRSFFDLVWVDKPTTVAIVTVYPVCSRELNACHLVSGKLFGTRVILNESNWYRYLAASRGMVGFLFGRTKKQLFDALDVVLMSALGATRQNSTSIAGRMQRMQHSQCLR